MKVNPLRQWRKENGVSAVSVALKLDLSEQSVLSYETGRFEPSRKNLHKLAELMKLEEEKLKVLWTFWKRDAGESKVG